MFGISKNRSARACLSSVAALLVGLTAAACGGEEVSRSLSASVSLDLPDSLPAGSPFDIGYTWTPAADFVPPADDFRVFVHFVDPDGRIVAQDDHYPPVPTSQWVAGEPISYRHWVYIDPELKPDYFDFFVGLYEGDEQIATMTETGPQNRPLVHSVIMHRDDQGGVPVYVEGFEDRERSLNSEDPNGRQWQWMRGRGLVAFGNPRGPSTLHLRARSPLEYLGGAQTATIKVGERELARFEVSDSASEVMRFDFPADAFGEGDWVELSLEVEKTFVPAQVEPTSDDTRELGLQIFWMYLAR